jgi:hypothetical protein
MAENKTKPTKLSVAAFIDALPEPTRRADAKALVKLMRGRRKAENVGAIHHWLRQLPLQIRERTGGRNAGRRFLAT